LDSMASTACLSRFHFARAFRQAVGQSPHRYVSARRLERAKAMLAEADRPLIDIALTLSFSSQANFTRAFKQATGLAPGQFRREIGSGRHNPLQVDIRPIRRDMTATNDNKAAFREKPPVNASLFSLQGM